MDDIPESPICPALSNKVLGHHHINGITSPTHKVPPPVPPKQHTRRKEEPLDMNIRIRELEKELATLKDKLATQEKLMESQEEELPTLRQQNRETLKREKKLQHKNDCYENAMKARRAQEPLKKWSSCQPAVTDLHKVITLEDLRDPQELVQQFVESERIYLNVLEAIHYFFYQPIQTMAVFKKDIITTQQFQAIFLNSPQILTVHRLFYDQLYHLRFLPKDARIEEFLIILERTIPSFSLYSGFQSDFFMQNLQRELSQWHSKTQISLLLAHLESKTEGKTLADLLRIPAQRLSEYTNLLKPFMEDRMKMTRYVNDTVIKRFTALNSFITSLQIDLLDEKGEWECIAEKLKVISKSSPDGPIPLEMFNPDTKLVKQGPIIVTEMNGKEVQKTCFLFTTHIALADKTQNHHIIFSENAMKPLAGATLYANVDMGGQIIQPDIKSGLEEDMLGFRINFQTDHLILKVGRPNERKQWLENIQKTLEKITKSETALDMDFIIPDVSPKIAAASLEKLFQHLTNPQIADRDDFIEVFLNTYPSFTTPKNVLTALFNCIHCPKEKTPDPTSSTQVVTNHVFTFNMDDNMDSVSCSTSLTSMSVNSQNYDSSGSDSDLIDSPETPRKTLIPHTPPSATSTPTNAKPRPLDVVVSRASISTDSDSSPYTSGVPVSMDTKREAANGWQDPETSLIQATPTSHSQEETSTDSAYVTFHRPISRESGSYGDTEDDDFMSLSQPTTSNSYHTLDDMVTNTCPPSSLRSPPITSQDSYSLRVESMNSELDGACKVMSDVLFSLQEPSPPREPQRQEECFSKYEDEANFESYTGRTSRKRNLSVHHTTERLSSSSPLSFSEPDLAMTSVNKPVSPPITVPPTCSQTLNRSEDRSPLEDELLSSLPATVMRKFADPSPIHLSAPSPKKGGRFSISFAKSNKKERSEMPRKSMPGGTSISKQLSVSNSLYFSEGRVGSPEAQKRSLTSPARAGFGNLFKKKVKSNSMNKSLSINFTDGGDQLDAASPRKGSGGRVKRNTSLGPQIKRPSRYENIDEFSRSPNKSSRERADDGSPRLCRKTSIRNFNLASKIFVVLNKWIQLHFEDFTDPELIDLLDDFLKTSMSCVDPVESELATETFDLLNSYRSNIIYPNPTFGNLLSRITTLDVEDIDWERPAKNIKELDLCCKSSKESGFLKAVSEQITLILFAHYNAILRSELLNCNWKKKDKDKTAANICRMISRTNEMTCWICTEVLRRETVAMRAIVIENFICIAWYCYKHYDMHSALTITLALSSSCIKRLLKSWDAIDRKARQKYEKLKDATDHHEKCKKLREKLEDVTLVAIEKTGELPSALPYIGAYLEQIYVLDIGLQTYSSDGLVNFVKMTKLSALVETVLQYQRVPYNFGPRLEMIAYITSAQQLSDNELYDLSVTREPSKS